MQVVGVVALFFGPAPIMMKQGYLIVTGVATAYMFTFIPEWSTWVLLLAMALYDICAVLTPHGPLKVSSQQSNVYKCPSCTQAFCDAERSGTTETCQLHSVNATIKTLGSYLGTFVYIQTALGLLGKSQPVVTI